MAEVREVRARAHAFVKPCECELPPTPTLQPSIVFLSPAPAPRCTGATEPVLLTARAGWREREEAEEVEEERPMLMLLRSPL